MKKENIALGIFLAFIVGAGIHFYSLQTVPQNVAEINPVVVHREVRKVVTNPPTTSATPPPEQSGKIDEHLTINNELRDVNFCGKTYKVKQVLIDGVDVVQRVAEIVATVSKKSDPKTMTFIKDTCDTVKGNPQNELAVEFVGTNPARKKRIWYPIQTDIRTINVNIETYEIYDINGFDGSQMGPVGKLK